MAGMLRRAEELVRGRQREKVRKLADELKGLLGDAAVEADDTRVLVRGRGIVRRWLTDPGLRFLAGGMQ